MTQPSESPPHISSALPHGERRILAIGGGRPGVGHSVLATNLAVYLAQLGRRVVLVDADGTCPALHSMLNLSLPEPKAPSDAFDTDELELTATSVPGLSLIAQEYTRHATVPLRPGRKPRWAKALKFLDADYIIVDLGPGTSVSTLDLYLNADFGICVTAPDPPSVEATYRFLKALHLRQVRRLLLKDRFRLRQLERALLELPPLPSPIELVRAISRYDEGTAQTAAQHLRSVRTYLTTNNTRMRGDAELGRTMVDLAERYLGAHLDDLGHVEHDDAIWLSVVRRRPLLLDNPTSKSARNVERIARRIVAVATSRDMVKRAPIDFSKDERNLYEVLWTHRGASDEDVRRAYKRQRDVFQPGSLALSSLMPDAQVLMERGRVEEAQKTLLDPVRRRAYDLSFFPDMSEESAERSDRFDEARLAEQALLREQLTREIHAETEFTGPLLRRVRESQGILLEEIAKTTKISMAHLGAIEEDAFDQLPAEVYTRGFVTQIAQLLRLDATQATRTYIRRLRAARRGHHSEVID